MIRHLLLLIAAILFIEACAMVYLPLAVLAASAWCAAFWYLLAPTDEAS